MNGENLAFAVNVWKSRTIQAKQPHLSTEKKHYAHSVDKWDKQLFSRLYVDIKYEKHPYIDKIHPPVNSFVNNFILPSILLLTYCK